jgi:hypothetical protein
MSDLRYVGLTAICIFLALSIGLMIGYALGSPDRRDRAYESVRREFDLLRADNQRVGVENDAYRRRLAARDQALRDLLPVAVRGRLAGATVALVICGDLDDGAFRGDLENALRAAGAEIGPVARIPDHLRVIPSETRSRLARAWAADQDAASGPFDAAGWLTRGLVQGASRERMEELATASGIDLRGGYGTPVRRVLLLTVAPDEARANAIAADEVPDRVVADAAQALQARIVAAEPEETAASAVERLGRSGITTVDNIDTPAGQIAAVLALAGGDGRFGSKPGAARSIPAPATP